MHKSFHSFLDIIKTNMAAKGSTNEQIVSCLSSVGEKYKNSPIFEDLDLDEFDDDMIDYIEEKFGKEENIDKGLQVMAQMNSVIDQDDLGEQANRIMILQEYYKDSNFFPPEEMESEREVDDKGAFGRTLLHEAVLRQDKDRIIELLEEGASTDIKDNNGLTPYETAILEDYTEIIELFKSKGIEA